MDSIREWKLTKIARSETQIGDENSDWIKLEPEDNNLSLRIAVESKISTIRHNDRILELYDFENNRQSIRVYKKDSSLLFLKMLKGTVYKCRVLFKEKSSSSYCSECYSLLNNLCSNRVSGEENKFVANSSPSLGYVSDETECENSPSLLESPLPETVERKYNWSVSVTDKEVPEFGKHAEEDSQKCLETKRLSYFTSHLDEINAGERVGDVIQENTILSMTDQNLSDNENFQQKTRDKLFSEHSNSQHPIWNIEKNSINVVSSSSLQNSCSVFSSVGKKKKMVRSLFNSPNSIKRRANHDFESNSRRKSTKNCRDTSKSGSIESDIQILPLGLTAEEEIVEVFNSVQPSKGKMNQKRKRRKKSVTRSSEADEVLGKLKEVAERYKNEYFGRENASSSGSDEQLMLILNCCLLNPRFPYVVSKLHDLISK